MTYLIRDALERMELPSDMLARLVPRSEDAARWRVCDGPSENTVYAVTRRLTTV